VAEDRQPERVGPTGRGRTGPGRGRRRLLPVAAAVALLALVAVGSLRGPLGSGRGRARYPADLVDSLMLLLLLAMVAAGALALVAFWADLRRGGERRRRGGSYTSLLLPMAAVVLLWLFRNLLGLGAGRDDPPPDAPTPPSTLEVPALQPQHGWAPLVVAGVALAVMVGVAVAQLVAERRRRGPPGSPAERLVELLDDTLEDLEGEPDPRRAVIAAWARMEHGLAAAGLPRHPAEAMVGSDTVHRLTGLFERAKFSHHRIDPEDRSEAIAALRAVRRELAEVADATETAGPGGGR